MLGDALTQTSELPKPKGPLKWIDPPLPHGIRNDGTIEQGGKGIALNVEPTRKSTHRGHDAAPSVSDKTLAPKPTNFRRNVNHGMQMPCNFAFDLSTQARLMRKTQRSKRILSGTLTTQGKSCCCIVIALNPNKSPTSHQRLNRAAFN
jgi:hypothetical protein